MIARLVSISGLLVVWLALMESITVGSVLGGLAIGFGLFVLFPDRDGGTSVSTIRPLRVVALAVYFTVQFLEANVHVALTVIAPTPARLRRGIVGIPVVSTSRTLRAVLANAVSLTPGTFIVDFDEDTATMYCHVLDMASPDAVRFAIHRLERVIARAFGPAAEVAELDRRIDALAAVLAAADDATPPDTHHRGGD